MPRLPFDPFRLIAPVHDRLNRRVSEEALRFLLRLTPDVALLDLGGGTGRVSERFHDEAARTIVVEPSVGMLARRRSGPRLTFVRGVAEALPLRDGSVHRVLCVDAFHHFRDHRMALMEMARVLAPGGIAVVQDFNRRTWFGRAVRALEAAALMGSTFHDSLTLQTLASETGLDIHVYNDDAREFFLALERPESR